MKPSEIRKRKEEAYAKALLAIKSKTLREMETTELVTAYRYSSQNVTLGDWYEFVTIVTMATELRLRGVLDE